MDFDIETHRAYYEMTPQMQSFFIARYGIRRKQPWIFYLWCIFLGLIGAHKFYLEENALGYGYLFTAGLWGFGILYDLITGVTQVRNYNIKLSRQIFFELKASYGEPNKDVEVMPNVGLPS